MCTFPPISEKIYNFPLFSQNLYTSSYFRSIYVFPFIYLFFLLPYVYHDAFMHHALHVLDTHGLSLQTIQFMQNFRGLHSIDNHAVPTVKPVVYNL